MFENLSKLLKIPETANPTVKKDAVAALLKTSPKPPALAVGLLTVLSP